MPDKNKACSKCGEVKPLDAFTKQKSCRGGYRPDCKRCLADAALARRNANLEEHRERDRLRYQNDPERRANNIAAARKSYNARKDEISAQRKAAYEADRDAILAAKRADRGLRKDHINALVRASRAANAARVNERQRKWAAANPDRVKRMARKQYEKNPAAYKQRAAERRAQVAAVTVEPIDRMAIFERDGGRCRICTIELQPNGWHLDHIVPISLGGPHVWANVQALCAPCNLSKHARLEGQISLPV